MSIRDQDWKFTAVLKGKLAKLEYEEPSRLILNNEILYVPLFLEIGEEKSDVIKKIVEQVEEVVALLK